MVHSHLAGKVRVTPKLECFNQVMSSESIGIDQLKIDLNELCPHVQLPPKQIVH